MLNRSVSHGLAMRWSQKVGWTPNIQASICANWRSNVSWWISLTTSCRFS